MHLHMLRRSSAQHVLKGMADGISQEFHQSPAETFMSGLSRHCGGRTRSYKQVWLVYPFSHSIFCNPPHLFFDPMGQPQANPPCRARSCSLSCVSLLRNVLHPGVGLIISKSKLGTCRTHSSGQDRLVFFAQLLPTSSVWDEHLGPNPWARCPKSQVLCILNLCILLYPKP